MSILPNVINGKIIDNGENFLQIKKREERKSLTAFKKKNKDLLSAMNGTKNVKKKKSKKPSKK